MTTKTATHSPTVTISGDTLTVDRIVLIDAGLVGYVAETAEADRAELVESGLRVGLLALRSAGVTINVDYIENELARLLRKTDESHEKAAATVATSLRETFGDGEGRVPRMLEEFLGDKGQLRHLVDDLFDEERRDSAIGRMRTLLAGYFDGDGAILGRMLDPRRADSPLHGFRTELREALSGVNERLLRLEAGREARAEERAKGTAKGGDFEDEVEACLGVIARGCGDVVESTARVVGDSARCRKGDFVQTVNPSSTQGVTVRIAIEAKSGAVRLATICGELDAARENRGAAVAVAVFAPGRAPSGCAPLTLHGEHVICEADPDDPSDVTLETAMRLARALALAASRERGDDVDLSAVRRLLDRVRDSIRTVRSMKSKLTSIGTVAGEVSSALDTLRQGVLDSVAGIEEEIARGDDVSGHQDVA